MTDTAPDAKLRRRSSEAQQDDQDEHDARVSSREGLRFLTRAGRVLSSSLDPDQTLKRLVRLAVPRVACFAAIDLARNDRRLQRVAYSHIDESKAPLLDRPEPFRPEEQGLLPIQQVLDDGRALMIERVHVDWPYGEEGLERLRMIDGQSLMIVPLVVRDQTLGALTLGSTRTDRHYRQSDLSLARELARSAALALENGRLYQQAERAIASRDEVLAVVSHDLRNPVNRVQLAAELLLEADQVLESGRSSVGIIMRAADEMSHLIGDLLDVARIDAGRLSVDRDPLPLDRLLERIDESHAPAARARRLQWCVQRPGEDITIHADEERLLQALGNLIGNAIKFTPSGGEVRVETTAADGALHLSVCDTGPGMSPEQLEHVFDRFWQAGSGDRRGAGLGLAIARGIAEAHGGELWLESEPGNGTTASLRLPLEPSAPSS